MNISEDLSRLTDGISRSRKRHKALVHDLRERWVEHSKESETCGNEIKEALTDIQACLREGNIERATDVKEVLASIRRENRERAKEVEELLAGIRYENLDRAEDTSDFLKEAEAKMASVWEPISGVIGG